MGDRGAAVASTLSDTEAQFSRLANSNSMSREANITLSVSFVSDNLCRELGTFCYILTGQFGYVCIYVRELKGVAEWVAFNRDAFEQAVLNSRQTTGLLDDISCLLLEYLNTCIQASCTGT